MTGYVVAYLATTAIFVAMLFALHRHWLNIPRQRADLKSLDARLVEIDKKVVAGELSDSEAAASRLELMRGALRGGSSDGGPVLPFRRSPLVAAGVLATAALVAVYLAGGFPTATSDTRNPYAAADESDALANLKGYVFATSPSPASGILGPMSRPEISLAGEDPTPSLPDVDTMIARLAERLENDPGNAEGWRMLGWSYFHTSRFYEAEKAYAKAVALKPGDSELTATYEEAKAKTVTASGAASEPKTTTADTPASKEKGPSALDIAKAETMPATERDAMIWSMVDGLAARLEASPRDAEGWIKLIRSRTVLGERDAAAAALRKALDVFKDESEQSTKISAVANELGVNAD